MQPLIKNMTRDGLMKDPAQLQQKRLILTRMLILTQLQIQIELMQLLELVSSLLIILGIQLKTTMDLQAQERVFQIQNTINQQEPINKLLVMSQTF